MLLAYALSFPVDILILDEPTNDLDIETLEVLENYLLESNTTLLLTSHDRFFINEVASSLWVIQPDQTILQFDGSLDDYDSYVKNQAQTESQKSSSNKNNPTKTNKSKTKLSYHENRLLDSLPQNIEKLEQELEAIQQTMSAPNFYSQPHDIVIETQQKLADLENNITDMYTQWETLSLKEAELQNQKTN